MLRELVIYSDVFQHGLGDSKMDDYQEELLEYQAFELDPLEPAEDGIRDQPRSRGLGDVYKRQGVCR